MTRFVIEYILESINYDHCIGIHSIKIYSWTSTPTNLPNIHWYRRSQKHKTKKILLGESQPHFDLWRSKICFFIMSLSFQKQVVFLLQAVFLHLSTLPSSLNFILLYDFSFRRQGLAMQSKLPSNLGSFCSSLQSAGNTVFGQACLTSPFVQRLTMCLIASVSKGKQEKAQGQEPSRNPTATLFIQQGEALVPSSAQYKKAGIVIVLGVPALGRQKQVYLLTWCTGLPA